MAKINFKKLALLFVLLFVGVSASAQSIKDIRINEVLYVNDNLTVEKFGWIELHNTGYSSLNVGGCYISIAEKQVETGNNGESYSVEDGVTYRIPTTSPAMTTIPPQGFLVIYAGGVSSQGPNYANFDLRGAKGVYFADASGKILLDKFVADGSSIQSDVSLGRDIMTYKEMLDMKKQGISEKVIVYDQPTPGAINIEIVKETPSEDIIKKDPIGYGMTIIAMIVVFGALLMLFIVFKCIGIANQKFEKRKEITSKPTSSVPSSLKRDRHLEASGEVIAAISIALKQYRIDVDNIESNILTINKVARSYSPWSSKIHGLTQLPNRK